MRVVVRPLDWQLVGPIMVIKSKSVKMRIFYAAVVIDYDTCVCEWLWVCVLFGVGKGVNGGCTPLPTRPQRNSAPASFVSFAQDVFHFKYPTVSSFVISCSALQQLARFSNMALCVLNIITTIKGAREMRTKIQQAEIETKTALEVCDAKILKWLTKHLKTIFKVQTTFLGQCYHCSLRGEQFLGCFCQICEYIYHCPCLTTGFYFLDAG